MDRDRGALTEPAADVTEPALGRAALQLAFGIGQMLGATAAVVLLLREGPTVRVVLVCVATTALALVSRRIFPRRPKEPPTEG